MSVKTISQIHKPLRRKKIFPEESKVQQNLSDRCDINQMLKKFKRTGVISLVKRKPVYGDFSNGTDFKEASDKIIQAQEDFMSLPAEIRDRFKHNPFHLLEFLSKEENREEALKLGIISEEEPELDYVPVKVLQEEPQDTNPNPSDDSSTD